MEDAAHRHRRTKDLEEDKGRLKSMKKYESYDFSQKDWDVERSYRAMMQSKDYDANYCWRWFMVVLVGVLTGLLSFCTNYAITGLSVARLATTERLIQRTGGFWRPFSIYVGLAAVYCAIASIVVAYIEPAAAGSGLPEMVAYFNGVHMRGLLSLRTLCVKITSAIFVLAAGLVAEGEAPLVHAGAILGGGVASGGSRKLSHALGGWHAGFPRRWRVSMFHDNTSHRDFCAIGAACGSAVAFAAPFAGIAFIAEESAAALGPPVYWRAAVASAAAIITLNICIAAVHAGPNFWRAQLFPLPLLPGSNIMAAIRFSLWELPVFAAMGVVGGLAGSAFVYFNSSLLARFRAAYVPATAPIRRVLEVVALGLLTGTIWMVVLWQSPCADLPPLAQQRLLAPLPIPLAELILHEYELFPRLWCPAGTYNAWGVLFFSQPRLSLRRLLQLSGAAARAAAAPARAVEQPDTVLLGTPLVWLFLGVLFVLVGLSYGATAALGVVSPLMEARLRPDPRPAPACAIVALRWLEPYTDFATGPGIRVGAAAGVLTYHLVRTIARRCAADVNMALPTYAVVGAASLLGGGTRLKWAAAMIVVEATGTLQLALPVTIAVLCAKAVGDRFTTGIFEAYLWRAAAPFLHDPSSSTRTALLADRLSVSDVMTRRLTALPPIVNVGHLLTTLRTSVVQVFPVSEEAELAARGDAPYHVVGEIERVTLLKMLQHRLCLHPPGAASPSVDPGSEPGAPRPHASRAELLDLIAKVEQRPYKTDLQADQVNILRGITVQEEALDMDLRTYMNHAAVMVGAGASLTRCLQMFRYLGLHHLHVAPPDPRSVGFVTRKDLVQERARLVLAAKRTAMQGRAVDATDGHLHDCKSGSWRGDCAPGLKPRRPHDGGSPCDSDGKEWEEERRGGAPADGLPM